MSKWTKEQQTRIELRGEALEITKRWLHSGDVKVHKEILTEDKTVIVPISREELVIEKIDLTGETPYVVETLRIPLSEEQVEVTRKPVLVEHVSVYKRHFQESEHVETTLKKERALVEVDGDCIVVDDGLEK